MPTTQYLKEFSTADFFDLWEQNASANSVDIAAVKTFFAPYIFALPRLVTGEYYWHIFENVGAVSKIVFAGGAVEKLTPTNTRGLISAPPEEFFTFFHPDDLKPTFTFLAKMFDTLIKGDDALRRNFNYCIYMRMKDGNGVYQWFSMQYPALYFDDNGVFKFGMVVYTQVGHLAAGLDKPMLTLIDSTDADNPVLSTFFIDNENTVTRQMPALSAREKQIVALLSQGKSSKQIGAELGLAKSTVDNHRQRLLKKFGVSTSAALTIKAALG
jgi:DNA-binding CsgD family transcriptional regulator